jgi:hypothetical protein
MKHILPILTITTLAAAASAQSAAAPAGLSYNRVSLSREGQNNSIAVSSFLGSSNVLATVSTTSIGGAGDNYTSLAVGYVFKNVAFATDATLSVSTGNASSNSAVGLQLRRALSEVVSGLEISLGYTYQQGSGAGANFDSFSAELSYNINKTWSVAYGIVDPKGAAQTNVVSVRHNF